MTPDSVSAVVRAGAFIGLFQSAGIAFFRDTSPSCNPASRVNALAGFLPVSPPGAAWGRAY